MKRDQGSRSAPSNRIRIQRRSGGIAAGAAIVGIVAFIVILGPGATWMYGPGLHKLTPGQQATAIDAFRGRLINTGTVLLAAGVLFYTARNFRLSRESHVTDRYTKAIEQLGSAGLDVRLGAIYALERIMADSPRDHPTIVEVLAAYVREHSPIVAPEHRDPDTELDPRATDVQAAMTVLGRRPSRREERGRLNLRYTDLTRAELNNAYLTCADLTGARLTCANLVGTDLTGADLIHADLTDAKLTRADLTGANLTRRANLTRTNLTEAVLTRAKLTQANLTRADLTGTNLNCADLTDARLTRARLTRANLTDADLTDADLTDADLTDAKLPRAKLGDAKLTRANLARADLARAVVISADLTGADLTGANLMSANLMSANLTDANLTDANLARAFALGAVFPTGSVGSMQPDSKPDSGSSPPPAGPTSGQV